MARARIQKENQGMEQEIGRLKEINARRKEEITDKLVWEKVCEDLQRREELKSQLEALKNVSYWIATRCLYVSIVNI
jgi:hypothetical protein